jgi:hypothetical protein
MTCCLSIQHGRSDSYVWYTFGVGRPWLALTQEARLSFLYHTLLTYLSLPEALFSHLADNGLVKVVLWDQVPGSLVFRHSCVSISRHSFYLLSQTRGKTQTMCNSLCTKCLDMCHTENNVHVLRLYFFEVRRTIRNVEIFLPVSLFL